MDSDITITWSAHHAEEKRGLEFEVSISTLLPLLRDEAHYVATVRHSMNKVKEAIAYLNQGQVLVITADQPIYDLAEQFQWQWPAIFGDNNLLPCLMGCKGDGSVQISWYSATE